MPDSDEQRLRLRLFFVEVFQDCFESNGLGTVTLASDFGRRVAQLAGPFQNPDLAYYSAENATPDQGPSKLDGPDFLLEITCSGEPFFDKLPTYAAYGTKEVLILERDPWKLHIFRLKLGRLRRVGIAVDGHAGEILSGVLPLSFRLVRSRPRPKIFIRNTETGQDWKF